MTLCDHDIPADVDFGDAVAVDGEAMGLRIARDRLCLLQLADAQGNCFLVRLTKTDKTSSPPAPNLKKLLENPSVLKIFHFARFDVAALYHHMNILCQPIYCTRTASKFARTYTDRHGLSVLCREFFGFDISKQQQSSDWGNTSLSKDQIRYAYRDVLYLHRLMERLNAMLEREGRMRYAQACFDFLPQRALIDLGGWEEDIFAH
ncbi:MAG: ribonuclease D [Alphaproteobacteria bacterium GM7ARS4]|nr:ribonuclease D [Alphaproteobacteria bacterium GM7ARS4]